MIEIIKMNNSKSFINPLLIEEITETPDVMITLNNGKKIIVKNKVVDIIEQMMDFWKSIYHLEYKVDYLKKLSRSTLNEK